MSSCGLRKEAHHEGPQRVPWQLDPVRCRSRLSFVILTAAVFASLLTCPLVPSGNRVNSQFVKELLLDIIAGKKRT